MQPERYPLPFGWVKEVDQSSGRSFYVDTKATPPRSIWTHPYEDDEYLKAHPDVREKVKTNRFGGSEPDLPPPSFEESQRRHSFGEGRPSSSQQSRPTSMPVAGSSKPRGPIGTLKDQLFGTKEERKADKLRRKEQDRLRREAQQQQIQQENLARQQYYASQQSQCGNDPRFGGGYDRGFGGGYDPRFGGPGYGGGFGSNSRRRGGGGIGLPLLGGLAGGLLLGDILDGGFGGGGFDGGFGGGFGGF